MSCLEPSILIGYPANREGMVLELREGGLLLIRSPISRDFGFMVLQLNKTVLHKP